MKKATPPITLDKVKLAFEKWRANKKNGRFVPNSLWNKVNAITPFYGPGLICKTLGISGGQYHKKIPHSKLCTTFVEVPVKSLSPKNHMPQSQSTNNGLMEVEIYRLDGSHLSIKRLDNQAVSNLIQTFLG